MAIWYVNPASGSNANAGTSWDAPLLDLNGVTAGKGVVAGDYIKVAKSPGPFLVGSGTWINGTRIVTLEEPAYSEAELLTNTGFETIAGTPDDGINDTFTGWGMIPVGLSTTEATTNKRSGSYALKFTNMNGTPYGYATFSVVPNSKYKLSFWTAGDGYRGGLYSVWDNSQSQYIVNQTATNVIGSGYQQITADFTAPVGCTQARVYLYGHATSGSRIYFDDVSVKQSPTNTTYLIDACEHSPPWTALNTNSVSYKTDLYKFGTKSMWLWSNYFAPTGIVACKTFDSPLDLSLYGQLNMWIYPYSAMSASHRYSFRFCSDPSGEVVVSQFDLQPILVGGRWMPITIPLSGGYTNIGNNIRSLALYKHTETTSADFFIDDIIACLPANNSKALTLNSLISKYEDTVKNVDGWFGIQSISGSQIILEQATQFTPANSNFRGYTGSTGKYAIYRLEAYKGLAPLTSAAANQNITVAGANRTKYTTYSGGWNPETDTQDSVTVFDGLNGWGYGLYNTTSYTKFFNLGVARCFYANINSGSYNSKFIHCGPFVNNYMGLYCSWSSNETIINCNANNNEVYGFLIDINGVITVDSVNSKNNYYYGYATGGTSMSIVTNSIAANNGQASYASLGNVDYYISNSVSSGSIYGILSYARTYCYNINTINDYYESAGGYRTMRIYASKHAGVVGDVRIINSYGTIIPQTSIVYNSTYAYKFAPTHISITTDYPLSIPVAKVLSNPNKIGIVTTRMMRNNDNLNMRAVIRADKNRNVYPTDWLQGWWYRKRIDIAPAAENLTNFPLYIPLSGDYDVGFNCGPSGHDIRFTSSDGVTPLTYEREYFHSSANCFASGTFWVRTNISSSNPTTLYLYYGNYDNPGDVSNPTGVWDSSYRTVLHLNETNTQKYQTYFDSTRRTGASGISDGYIPTATNAIAGAGQRFDGSDDRILINTNVSNSNIGSGDFTWSIWFNVSGVLPNNQGLGKRLYYYPAIYYNSLGKIYTWWYGDGGTNPQLVSNISPATGVWHHFVLRRKDGLLTHQIDGIVDSATLIVLNSGTQSPVNDSCIGGVDAGEMFRGVLDEHRYSTIARSVNWSKFEYDNIANPTGIIIWSGQYDASISGMITSSANTWQDVSLQFKTSRKAAVEVDIDTWGGSTYSGYAEDIRYTQEL